jgi:hypothetical protein
MQQSNRLKIGQTLLLVLRSAIAARYHETHFMDWVPELKARYGLKLLGEP